jgi:hypothetical protein
LDRWFLIQTLVDSRFVVGMSPDSILMANRIIEITELMDVKVKLEEIQDVVENLVTLLLIATIMNLGSM